MQLLLAKIDRMAFHCQKLELLVVLLKQLINQSRFNNTLCSSRQLYFLHLGNIVQIFLWLFSLFFPVQFLFMKFACSVCTCLGSLQLLVYSVTDRKHAHWVSGRLQIESRCERVREWCTGELPAVKKVVLLCYYAHSISLVKSVVTAN